MTTARFAAIADIHGNSDALRAVLEDMERLGVTEAVNLGDHFSGPLDAAGTAELLLARDFPSILGNHDRYLIEQAPEKMHPSDRVAHDALQPAHLDWLRSLSGSGQHKPDVFLCHGTPASDTTYWLEAVREDGSIAMADRAAIESHAEGITASLILCAHTHTPRTVRLSDGRMIVNPGSVGCPAYDDDTPHYHVMQMGTPAACYAILDRTDAGWAVTFRQVAYDTERMVALALSHDRQDWAKAVKSGWIT